VSARSVLLTVSGRIPADLDAQIAAGRRPRADYRELARGLGADLIDVDTARRETGTLGRLIERVAGAGVLLAWACFRRRAAYRLIITDGEQIGLPLAMLCTCVRPARAPRHVMITHVISVRKKMLFLDWLRAESRIDRFVVYASWQRQFIIRRWRLPESRVIRVPFMVDARFFAPERVRGAAAIPQICAVGLERRDYPTLLRAVAGLPAGVVIAAASPWSKCADETDHAALPANVDVRRLSLYDLRQLYADSRFLVMPLNDVQFQAGVTAILEAMAMAKAVICSRVAGQTDVVVDGETGLYVPPNDPPALRRAIETLLAEPELAERMGQEGRRRVEADMSLERYVERFRAIADDVVAEVPAAAGL
jgi:glycosyltransferase involved in cell wall biosynthesis